MRVERRLALVKTASSRCHARVADAIRHPLTQAQVNSDLHPAMTSDAFSFYQGQLAILAAFCVLAVLIERRSSSKGSENGHARSTSQAENGSAGTGWKRASSAALLARQYLVVYGLVMCELEIYFCRRDTYSASRCRLAARPICVLALQGTVRVS